MKLFFKKNLTETSKFLEFWTNEPKFTQFYWCVYFRKNVLNHRGNNLPSLIYSDGVMWWYTEGKCIKKVFGSNV